MSKANSKGRKFAVRNGGCLGNTGPSEGRRLVATIAGPPKSSKGRHDKKPSSFSAARSSLADNHGHAGFGMGKPRTRSSDGHSKRVLRSKTRTNFESSESQGHLRFRTRSSAARLGAGLLKHAEECTGVIARRPGSQGHAGCGSKRF